MLTAETITDAQIHELRGSAWEWADADACNEVVTECSFALAKFRDPAGLKLVREARGNCASILNARAEGK